MGKLTRAMILSSGAHEGVWPFEISGEISCFCVFVVTVSSFASSLFFFSLQRHFIVFLVFFFF